MKRAAHSLRTRMVAALGLFALVTALVFSGFCVIFVYTVEDNFFDRMLMQEARHQEAAWRATGKEAVPLRPFVTLHKSANSFPPDLRRSADPSAKAGEYAGEDGRHYHVRVLTMGDGSPRHMVAEVSGELVVRPRMPSILSFLAVGIGVLLAFALALGYWLARRATEPLTRLTAVVAGAAPGQLPRAFAHRFPDNEIGLLAHSLDQAMRRIAGFIEREQHFTRDASHELRTPLAVIDGAAQLLASQALTPQAAAQLARIRSAATHMAQSVDTLLALAREELDAAPTQPVAVLALVEKAVVQSAHLLEGKQVEVAVDIDAALTLDTHAPALAILLANLIGNAFVHTRQGEVKIVFEEGALVVADSGPGIAPGLEGRLYQAGVKGEGSAGFGLGLSIASRLAARCGIRLEVGNASGGGTRAALHFQR